MKNSIFQRKDDHIELSQTQEIETLNKSWFKHIEFIHQALPELNYEAIDPSISFLNKDMRAPLLISALTGGTDKGKKINGILATIAEENHLAMMVGSQRIALEHPKAIHTFKIARENAPTVPLIANIGIAQIIQFSEYDPIERIIKMIDADALAIHLNSLQEIIQPGGDRNFQSGLQKISKLKDIIDVPIIIKETGSGISKETAKNIFNIGINMIDVAGAGGTSFSMIENQRNHITNLNQIPPEILEWGIPTAASILEVRSVATNEKTIIGSGGIRSGVEMAKAIAIGANLTGIGLPFIRQVKKGQIGVQNYVEKVIKEFKLTMFLTGSKKVEDLQQAPKMFYPPLLAWKNNRI